jgi:hypothetical protein
MARERLRSGDGERVVGAALGPAATAQVLVWAAARADALRARAAQYRPPLAPGVLAGRWRWERRHAAAATIQQVHAERWIRRSAATAAKRKRRLRMCLVALGARARVAAFVARQKAAARLTRVVLDWLYLPDGPMVRASLRALWPLVEDGDGAPSSPPPASPPSPRPLGPVIRPADTTAFSFVPLPAFNAGHMLRLCRANALSEGLLKTLQAHCRAG